MHRNDAYFGLVRAAWLVELKRTCLACALLLTASCTQPVVEPPNLPILSWADSVTRQGILSPVLLRLEVKSAAGDPLSGQEVRWRVVNGGGLVGSYSAGYAQPEPDRHPEVSTFTDSSGWASIWWMLGSHVGMQEVEASIAGATPLRQRVEALPGVMFVGVWRLAPELQAKLPADTMRVHATNYSGLVDRALDAVARGVEGLGITGRIRRGPGIDTTWVFHLDPAITGLGHGTAGLCVPEPPLLEADLERVLSSPPRSLCPWVLRLVRVEEVPGWYLERLTGG